MRKKIFICTIFLMVLLMCVGCNNSPEKKLSGYWMRNDGYVMSFAEDGTCVMGDDLYSYVIYDEKHLRLTDKNGNVTEFVYEIKGDELYIGLAEEMHADIVFTKNEQKQEEIKNRVQELKAAENTYDQVKKDYEDIENKEESERNSIKKHNFNIQTKKETIDEYLRNIQACKDDYEKEVADFDLEIQDNSNDPSYIESCKEYLELCKEYRDSTIKDYEEWIAECEKSISDSEEKIKQCENELENLKKDKEILADKMETADKTVAELKEEVGEY
ncbi:MAG: hypothetical protein V8R80_11595 [Eubacterium sp.]